MYRGILLATEKPNPKKDTPPGTKTPSDKWSFVEPRKRIAGADESKKKN